MGGSGEDAGRGTKRKPKKEKKKKSKKKKRQVETSQEQPLPLPVIKHNQQNNQKNEYTEGDSLPESSKTTATQMSWGDVFATASSVKPISLGDDFTENEISEIPDGGGDVGMVSLVAKEYLDKFGSSSSTGDEAKDQSSGDNDGLTVASHMKPEENNDIDNDIRVQGRLKEESMNTEHTLCDQSSKKKRKKERKKKKKKKKSTLTSSNKSPTDVPTTEPQSESGDKDSLDINHFPYPTDPDDHCESPAVAYEDILPILQKLAAMKNNKIRIYDPYYCNGSVIPNLAKIGFDDVYNKKEDCYKTWSNADTSQPYPTHDVLVTNPPYSGDHIQRLMQHVMSDSSSTTGRLGTEAWCLLMPNYVHKKDYFQDMIKKGICQPFYLVPKKRYVYIPPKNFRMKKESDVHKKSSPFVSMWYVWGGTKKKNDQLIEAYRAQGCSNCSLARSKSALRDLRRRKA